MRDDQTEREFQARQAARLADTSCPECGAPEDWPEQLDAAREVRVAELPAPNTPEATWISGPTELEKLHARTLPIPNRAGWRFDKQGREWFSASWL